MEAAAIGLRPRWGLGTTWILQAARACKKPRSLHDTLFSRLSYAPSRLCLDEQLCSAQKQADLHKFVLHAVNLVNLDHQVIVLPHPAGALEDGSNFVPQGHQAPQDPHINLQEGQCMFVPYIRNPADFLSSTNRPPGIWNLNATGATDQHTL